jgi:hypothetical protein
MAVVGTRMGIGLWLTGSAVEADAWYREYGLASYYGKGFHGSQTANGERFSQYEMTAAHRQLPLGTKVMVEHRETGKQAEVKITDRGPYTDTKRRVIDLSTAAADSTGLVESGVAPVRVVVTEEAAQQQKSPAEEVVYEVQVGAFADGDQAAAVLEQVQDWFPQASMAPRQGPAGEYDPGPGGTVSHQGRGAAHRQWLKTGRVPGVSGRSPRNGAACRSPSAVSWRQMTRVQAHASTFHRI